MNEPPPVSLLVLLQLGFALSSSEVAGPGLAFGLLGITADVLLVVAFGLGLADISVRMPRTSKSQESPA